MNVFALVAEIALNSKGYNQGLEQAENKGQGTANKLTNSFSKVSGMLGTVGGVAITAIGGAMLKVAQDSRAATADIRAQLGATKEEAEALTEVAKNVFASNFSTSVADAAQGVILVRQQMKGLATEDIQAVTEAAFALRNTFGIELPEATSAANTLMTEFGLTGEQAMNFITQGFQNGLNASGDFLDTIGEYSTQFADGGASAEQFFSLLESGMQGGMLGTDKAADAFKEFRIRIQDGSELTAQSLEALGISSDELFAKMASGKMTAAEAFDLVIGKLGEMEDPLAQAQAGVGLIGTQFEDLGPTTVTAMNMTQTSLEDMAGATDSLAVKYETLGMRIRGFGRKLLTLGEPIAGVMAGLGPMLVTAGQLGVALPGIGTAIGGLMPMLKGLKVSMMGLAIAGGPIMLVIAAVAALVAIFATDFLGIRSFVVDVVGTVIKWGGKLVTGFFDYVQRVVGVWIDNMKQYFSFFGNLLTGDFAGAWQNIKNIISNILSLLPGNIREGITKAMQALIDGVTGFFSRVKDAATGIVTTVIDTISGLPGQMLQVGKDIVQGLINGVTQMFGAARDTITNFAGNIGGWFKSTLGISSPSKVFMGYGRNLAEGLGIGLNKNLPRVTSRIDSFVESTARKFQGLQKRLQKIASTSVNFEGMLGGSGDFIRDRNLTMLWEKIQKARAKLEQLRAAMDQDAGLSRGDALAQAFLGPVAERVENTLKNLMAMFNQLDAKDDALDTLAEQAAQGRLMAGRETSHSAIPALSQVLGGELPTAIGGLSEASAGFSSAIQDDIESRRSFTSRLSRSVDNFERSVNRFTLADLRS